MLVEATTGLLLVHPAISPRPVTGRAVVGNPGAVEPVAPLSLVTMVLWGGLLTVGVIGFVVSPVRPVAQAAEPPPVTAGLLTVNLTTEPVLFPDEGAPPPAPELPPLLDPVIKPEMVPLTAVAAPEAAVAFALPVTGPVRIVEASQASFTRPVKQEATPAVARPAVQAITFGQGEGRQEAPEYPRQAKRERQEGAPGIRFSVGPNGRVLEAVLSAPSPWPLLNEAALKVIRERWQFRPGELRVFEVTIRFEMKMSK